MPRLIIREFGVDVDDDEGMCTLGVSEFADGEGTHFLLTCSEDDLEDADQDMDSYCITDNRGACTYGGVARAGLSNEIVLEFD